MLAAAGLLPTACGDDEADPCIYAVCAIDEPGCVERAAAAVACQLEQDVLQPKVRMLTAAQYVAESEAEAPKQTAADERDYRDYLRMQALLGLMPEDYQPDDAGSDYVRNFVAFYSPDKKEIFLLTDRAAGDAQDDYLILIHELVHAYQDAAWDLNAFEQEHAYTNDRWLGARALIEGDAVLYQNLASARLRGYAPEELDWVGYFGEWQQDSLAAGLKTETPALDVAALFPYAFGGAFTLDAWWDGGAARIADLFHTPPDSVRQVLGGFEVWPESLANQDASFDARAVAILPADYEIVTGTHEGVWTLNATLQRTAGGGLWAPELDGVAADFLSTWRWNGGEVVAIWRIRTGQPAALMATLTGSGTIWSQPGAPTTHLVHTIGSDVVLIAVSDGDANAVLDAITGWHSPDDAFPAADAGARPRPRRFDDRRIACPSHPRIEP